MHAADDRDGLNTDSEETDVILVGLVVADRPLGRRIRSMIAEMAEAEIVDPDVADVVLTDITDGHVGPQVILHDPAATGTVPNGIHRDAGKAVLRAAICLVAHGYRIMPSGDDRDAAVRSDLDHPGRSAEPLTAREQQVLERLAAGASNKMIARDLGISIATAKFHVGALLAKLHARNRTDAVAIGLRHGLLLV